MSFWRAGAAMWICASLVPPGHRAGSQQMLMHKTVKGRHSTQSNYFNINKDLGFVGKMKIVNTSHTKIFHHDRNTCDRFGVLPALVLSKWQLTVEIYWNLSSTESLSDKLILAPSQGCFPSLVQSAHQCGMIQKQIQIREETLHVFL